MIPWHELLQDRVISCQTFFNVFQDEVWLFCSPKPKRTITMLTACSGLLLLVKCCAFNFTKSFEHTEKVQKIAGAFKCFLLFRNRQAHCTQLFFIQLTWSFCPGSSQLPDIITCQGLLKYFIFFLKEFIFIVHPCACLSYLCIHILSYVYYI